MILSLLLGLLPLLAATLSELDVVEKNWMPWPTTLKDPKKEYVTVTLPAEILTETEMTTSTSTLTKIVYSHLTETITSITDKTIRTTETLVHNSVTTKTYTSLQVEKIGITSTLVSTITTFNTHTFTWRDEELVDGEAASASLRIMRYARHIESTILITSQPMITTTATRVSVQRGRTTVRSVLNTSSHHQKIINKTSLVVSTQTIKATKTENIIISTTITSFY